MEFTEKRKQELRKSLEQHLKSVKEGKRIHLDKRVLEQLMFFCDKEIGVNRPKYIIWRGDFLSKSCVQLYD